MDHTNFHESLIFLQLLWTGTESTMSISDFSIVTYAKIHVLCVNKDLNGQAKQVKTEGEKYINKTIQH